MPMQRALPLYAQVKEAMVAAIAAGDYQAGAQLPPQRELGEQYGASHMTIRRVINELIGEGVIYSVPGKGLFVATRKEQAEEGPMVSFTEDMARRGMVASSQILNADIVGGSIFLTQLLGVEIGTPLLFLRRLRLADGEPMAVQTTYLPYACCPNILKHDLARGSLYDILKKHYVLQLASGTTSAEAMLADQETADLLGLPLPAALLVTEQLSYLDDGTPVEFTRAAYRGDRYRLRVA